MAALVFALSSAHALTVTHARTSSPQYTNGPFPEERSSLANSAARIAILGTKGHVALFRVRTWSRRPETDYVSAWRDGKTRLRCWAVEPEFWQVDFGNARRFTINTLVAGDNHVFRFVVGK